MKRRLSTSGSVTDRRYPRPARGAGGPGRHHRTSILAVGLALACLAFVAGCGRKATREDCETVVDRNVELQLKALGVTDPAIVGKRRGEMRASMEKDISECVGKRVTDSMMVCVKTADTAEQIDKCLR